jgi:hypothetical protein
VFAPRVAESVMEPSSISLDSCATRLLTRPLGYAGTDEGDAQKDGSHCMGEASWDRDKSIRESSISGKDLLRTSGQERTSRNFLLENWLHSRAWLSFVLG